MSRLSVAALIEEDGFPEPDRFMMKSWDSAIACALLVCCIVLTASAGPMQELNPPVQSWFAAAPPLPQPQGKVVKVATAEDLVKAIEEAEANQTIFVADGHYRMPRYVEIRADNVTLRSALGHRQQVILDGTQSRHGELLGVRACSGVTIADLTIQNVRTNGFKINSETNVQKLTIYNCIIHNVWQRGVKGVKVPAENREAIRPTDCRIRYCLFYNDRPKHLSDDPADIANGNYVAGIDVMYAKDWTISDNVFVGIRGRTGEARGAVFLWMDSRDCTVERNIIIHCDTGICLGNSHRARFPIHCTNCTVRNNFITGAPENGILADYTRDCKIIHNTVHHPASRLQRLIRLVHDNEGLVVANNLLSGPPMRIETKSKFQSRGNVEKELTKSFVNVAEGNLHLKEKVPGVTGAAERLPEVGEDIDRRRRNDPTDVGAQQQL